MWRFRMHENRPSLRRSRSNRPPRTLQSLENEDPMNDDNMKTLLQEMQWVRKLLMLQTLAAGYKQKHLAAALGVSSATMSRMMPKGIAKQTATARAAGSATED